MGRDLQSGLFDLHRALPHPLEVPTTHRYIILLIPIISIRLRKDRVWWWICSGDMFYCCFVQY